MIAEKSLSSAPASIAFSVALILGLALASCVAAPGVTQAVAVVVVVVLSWYLLRRSRIAWGIVMIDAVGRLVEGIVLKDADWNLVVYAGIVVGLSLPSSIRFIWRDDAHPSHSQTDGIIEKTQEAIYRIFTFVVSWESGVKREGPWDAEGYRSMLGRVGLFTLFSLPVVVATYKWDQNSTSPVASVFADVAWTIYAILQVAFLVLCGMGLYRYLTRDRSHSKSETV